MVHLKYLRAVFLLYGGAEAGWKGDSRDIIGGFIGRLIVLA